MAISEETRRRMSESAKRSWADPEIRTRRSASLVATPERKKRASESQKGRKLTEEHKAKLRKPKTIRMDPVEYSRIKSEAAKRNWQDPVYREKVTNGNAFRPSKLELSLIPRMEKLGYSHTGAGDFFIVGEGRTRNPDFKKHGELRVVELYGKYWHRHERGLEHETIQWYKDAGFECIIVWEDEVDQLEELVF